MPRTKGSKNKPKTVTADFATQIAEKQSAKEALTAEIASITANIDTLKADLKEKKTALKKAEKEVTSLEAKKVHKSARVCHLHGLFPPFRRRFSATLSGLLATRTIFLNNERGTSKNAVTTFKEVHRNDGLQENSYASKYGVQPTRNGTQ